MQDKIVFLVLQGGKEIMCFSLSEELSISISVSNCQIQENVVSVGSLFSFLPEAIVQFPSTAYKIMHMCAIKVAVVVKPEIVSYCCFY